MWCNNRSVIAMSNNPAFHARTKHIEVQHHFIRQLVAEEKLVLKFCGTNEQNADLTTTILSFYIGSKWRSTSVDTRRRSKRRKKKNLFYDGRKRPS